MARPKKINKMKRICIHVTTQIEKKLEDVYKKTGINKSEIIREALKIYFDLLEQKENERKR